MSTHKFTPIETLICFNKKVSKLTRYKFWNIIKDNPISLTFDSVRGISFENYPEEELDAVILTIRLFIQKNDPISIENLYNNVYENSEIQIPSNLKERFIETKSKLDSYLDSSSPFYREKEGEGKGFGPAILPEEKIYRYPNKKLLKIMIYGNLSHLNQARKYEEVYGEETTGGTAKMYFIKLLCVLFEYIKEIDEINVLVIQHN